MAGPLERILQVVVPRRPKTKGVAQTNTFSPDRTEQVLSTPAYREHLTDIFTSRQAQDSQQLLQELFVHDPDVSAAVNAFLTLADTKPVYRVVDPDGAVDRKGMKTLNQIIESITSRYDYSKGFMIKPTFRQICEEMRYMDLLRGGLAEELVFDKTLAPTEIRHVDLATIEWFEKESNRFVPQQRAPTSNLEISLDYPTFFVSFFRRDPTRIYTYSPFVSAINTVAARQQVINDLYRIMQQTGFPRIDAEVMEEVLLKNAPATVRQDGKKQKEYVQPQLAQVQASVASLRSDQPFIHTDSVKMKIFNEKNPSNGLDISSVIQSLNAMNQAGLRSMATILGRGESGVNTASVEARVFSMNAEAINEPIAEVLSKMLTMALRTVEPTESKVEVNFRPVELRPTLELEPQLTMKSARLKEDLSLGIISDDEYHIEVYGRIRPDNAPELSGTGFMNQTSIGVDEKEVTPNSDPMGRSLAPEGSEGAQSNGVKKSE
jgi:hypothetical protein